MIRSDAQRVDPKRRQLDHKKKQFATAAYKEQSYPFRLNFYELPPTAEISLEEFETWAIDRLRSMFLYPCHEWHVLNAPSSRRTRSMFVSQQNPHRNHCPSRATAEEILATIC